MGQALPKTSINRNAFPWKSSLLNDGLKRQRGIKAQLLPGLSLECSWVLGDVAVEAEGDKATGSITIHNHSKGNSEEGRGSHRLGEIYVLSETPKA